MANTTNVTVILDDEKLEFVMDSDKTILDGALENGIDTPHSCQGGICTTCICKVVSGKAEMEDEYALSDDELEEGLILTCISKPLTDKITINFDDV